MSKIARALNPGDTVKLKSGGPNMTVESTDGTRVTCVYFAEKQVVNHEDHGDWFVFDPEVHRAIFNEITLDYVGDDEEDSVQ